MAGVQDLVVAGGVEVMSQVPIGSPTTVGLEHGMAHPRGGQGWAERYGDQEISQFRGAELIAEKWGLSREEMERYALESHARALRATADGLTSTRRSPRWRGLPARRGTPRPAPPPEKLASLAAAAAGRAG